MPALCINTNYSIRFLIFGIKNQRRRFHSLLIFHRINHTDNMMSGLKIALINIKLQDKLVITVAYFFDEKTKWFKYAFFFPAVKSYTAVLSFHTSAGVNCCMSSFLLPFNESSLWCMESQQGSNYKDIVCKRSLV